MLSFSLGRGYGMIYCIGVRHWLLILVRRSLSDQVVVPLFSARSDTMIPITLGWTSFLFWHGDEDAFVLLFVSTFGSREVKKSKEISCKIITKRAHHLLKLTRKTLFIMESNNSYTPPPLK